MNRPEKNINLVVHLGCVEEELKMSRLYGSREKIERLELVISEIEKIKHLENTIIYEGSSKKVVKNLSLTPDSFVRVYGAYLDMCLSAVDITLTRHSIPHELAENGYI